MYTVFHEKVPGSTAFVIITEPGVSRSVIKKSNRRSSFVQLLLSPG